MGECPLLCVPAFEFTKKETGKNLSNRGCSSWKVPFGTRHLSHLVVFCQHKSLCDDDKSTSTILTHLLHLCTGSKICNLWHCELLSSKDSQATEGNASWVLSVLTALCAAKGSSTWQWTIVGLCKKGPRCEMHNEFSVGRT